MAAESPRPTPGTFWIRFHPVIYEWWNAENSRDGAQVVGVRIPCSAPNLTNT